MWLILVDAGDPCGSWAVQKLGERGLAPIELVTGKSLASSLRWAFTMGLVGNRLEVQLRDGRSVSSGNLHGVLNRLTDVPLALADSFSTADQDYAYQEQLAFFLAWLHSLGPKVLNPPTPRGLCGEWRHFSEWVVLAGQAGLPVSRFQRGPSFASSATNRDSNQTTATAIVVGGQVVAPDALVGLEKACSRLSTLAGSPLLEVQFELGGTPNWVFAGATPLPNLPAGGERAADALAAVLLAGAGGIAP